MLAVISQSCKRIGEDSPKICNKEPEKKKLSNVLNKILFKKKKVHELLNFWTTISILDNGKRLTNESSSFGTILDVLHNGNCGYHLIFLGLQAISKTDLLESTEI